MSSMLQLSNNSEVYTSASPFYSFPPFFTLQPNLSTRSSQLAHWSSHILAYARHYHIFQLVLSSVLSTPLFTNAALKRSFSERDGRVVLEYMASAKATVTTANGEPSQGFSSNIDNSLDSSSSNSAAAVIENAPTIEWIDPKSKDRCWVWWRRKDEWAALIEDWVERTAQRGVVLTLFELTQGELTQRQEWWGMDGEAMRKVVDYSVKRGRATVFGTAPELGVKYH